MTYVLYNGSSTGTYVSIFAWANNTVQGALGWGLLLIMFCIVFFGTKRYYATTSHALLVSTTACSMLAGALRLMGVVNDQAMWIVFTLMAGAFIYSFHS